MKKAKFIAAFLCAGMIAGIAGCTTVETSVSQTETTAAATTESVQESESVTESETEAAAPVIVDSGIDYLAGHQKFEVTSADLVDGAWADVTSSLPGRGNNLSPALKWEAVDGAEEYVIYMMDMNSPDMILCGIMHWKSGGITVTELPQGWAPSSDYVGPGPGAGVTHVYEIYVVALKAPVERLKGSVRAVNPNFESFINGLDTDSEGNTGNILAYGKISGTFTG